MDLIVSLYALDLQPRSDLREVVPATFFNIDLRGMFTRVHNVSKIVNKIENKRFGQYIEPKRLAS